jgi:hypothetical protein
MDSRSRSNLTVASFTATARTTSSSSHRRRMFMEGEAPAGRELRSIYEQQQQQQPIEETTGSSSSNLVMSNNSSYRSMSSTTGSTNNTSRKQRRKKIKDHNHLNPLVVNRTFLRTVAATVERKTPSLLGELLEEQQNDIDLLRKELDHERSMRILDNEEFNETIDRLKTELYMSRQEVNKYKDLLDKQTMQYVMLVNAMRARTKNLHQHQLIIQSTINDDEEEEEDEDECHSHSSSSILRKEQLTMSNDDEDDDDDLSSQQIIDRLQESCMSANQRILSLETALTLANKRSRIKNNKKTHHQQQVQIPQQPPVQPQQQPPPLHTEQLQQEQQQQPPPLHTEQLQQEQQQQQQERDDEDSATIDYKQLYQEGKIKIKSQLVKQQATNNALEQLEKQYAKYQKESEHRYRLLETNYMHEREQMKIQSIAIARQLKIIRSSDYKLRQQVQDFKNELKQHTQLKKKKHQYSTTTTATTATNSNVNSNNSTIDGEGQGREQINSSKRRLSMTSITTSNSSTCAVR